MDHTQSFIWLSEMEVKMSKTAKKITALYCRTAQSSYTGIEGQKQVLLQYAKDHGLGPEEVAIYIDDGFSGLNFQRPELQRVLAGIRSGEIGEVVAKDACRYGRNSLGVYELARELREQYSVKLLTVMDGDFYQEQTQFADALLHAALEGGARR